ncbi:MAG TPA: peptidylprolyl isomerase, partial [Flavisolibacter sp.]|nr:peptidylprolyl isomerase [Flavisolibacter sp.]
MKKLLTACAVMVSLSATSQTLFYYGKDSVSVNEFLKAYHKNNTGPKSPKAFSNYLDLYINSRLKIKEAQSLGYDTLPQIVSDIAGLRQQILPAYLNDKESIDKMANEAFLRSQKDIHLAHLFFSFREHPDTAALASRVKEAMQKLTTLSFSEVARQYSDDPAAAENGGDLGWITAFSLPYELENLAYSLAPGKTSGIYRSRAGYHIFRNLAERKAIGRIRAAQILLSFPPGANEATRLKTRKLADSIYNSLLKGADFGKLAAQYSNDAISAAANGEMQEFGTGEYDRVFEDKVFSLAKDGAITPPFQTTHGFHIVKRIARVPIPAKADAKTLQLLREKTERSDRMNSSRSSLAKKVMAQTGFHKNDFSTSELWALSDSLINYQTPKQRISMTLETPLASFKNKKLTVADWISYAQMYRYKSDGSGIKPYPQIWEEFMESSALDYYQNNLEQFNDDFRQQIAEFVDGNLFFEIMQRQVWGPAQTDTAAIETY